MSVALTSPLLPVVTTKYVSRDCQMFPWGQNHSLFKTTIYLEQLGLEKFWTGRVLTGWQSWQRGHTLQRGSVRLRRQTEIAKLGVCGVLLLQWMCNFVCQLRRGEFQKAKWCLQILVRKLIRWKWGWMWVAGEREEFTYESSWFYFSNNVF